MKGGVLSLSIHCFCYVILTTSHSPQDALWLHRVFPCIQKRIHDDWMFLVSFEQYNLRFDAAVVEMVWVQDE